MAWITIFLIFVETYGQPANLKKSKRNRKEMHLITRLMHWFETKWQRKRNLDKGSGRPHNFGIRQCSIDKYWFPVDSIFFL